jgi:hypothetical protein
VFSVDTLVPTITAPAKRVKRKTGRLTKEGYYPDVQSSLECGVEADAEQIREVFAVWRCRLPGAVSGAPGGCNSVRTVVILIEASVWVRAAISGSFV